MAGSDDAFVTATFELIDALDQSPDPLDVQRRVFALVAQCGFTYFTITRLPQPAERLAPNVLLDVWPKGWLAHYDRSGHYRYDPVVRHCYRTVEPFLWSEVAYEAPIEARARRVMEEAAEHGMRAGFCVPIHDALGFQAVVSLAGDRIELPPKVRRGVHLLGLYAWGAADRTTTRRKPYQPRLLSSRERDVLAFAAVGRTGEEIADLLGLSPETVATHLKNARLKIGTRNTTHTVVEALRRRELTL